MMPANVPSSSNGGCSARAPEYEVYSSDRYDPDALIGLTDGRLCLFTSRHPVPPSPFACHLNLVHNRLHIAGQLSFAFDHVITRPPDYLYRRHLL